MWSAWYRLVQEYLKAVNSVRKYVDNGMTHQHCTQVKDSANTEKLNDGKRHVSSFELTNRLRYRERERERDGKSETRRRATVNDGEKCVDRL